MIYKALKGADLVFTQTIGPIGATTLLLARQRLRTTAAFIHSLDWEVAFQAVAPIFAKRFVPFFGRRWARFLYRRVQRLFMPSDGISEQFTWEGIHTSRRVIHLGVNTKQFVPGTQAQKKEIRTQLGFTDEDIVIGYHGRIAREKDLSTLVRAYIKLRTKHPTLKLLLIGNGVSSLEKKFAKQPGVLLYPAVNDVERFLPAIDIYALPSLTETTSLSVLEAMSCALPVVATPVGFVKDYITVNKTGLLTKKKDSYQLAKQLNKLIKNPEHAAKMGKEARAMVQKKFNWDSTASQLVDELETLL